MRGLFGALARGTQFKTADGTENLTWEMLLGHASSKAGVSVNIDSSLRTSTVLCCTRVLAEGCAQLPLKLYQADGETKQPAVDNPLYKLITRCPNEWMTAFEMREMLTMHAVLTGNGYAYLGRGGLNQEIQEIVPLIPSRVRLVQDVDWGLIYYVRGTDGTQEIPFTPDQIFHLRGPSWNGYLGMDALQLAREAIGLAIATEETHGRLFSNSARPGGVLSVEGELSDTNKERLKERVREQQEGIRNQFKTLVLDQKARWQSMAMTGVDAQHLETRRFQIEEICRHMRVFPQMVMHSDKTSTFASAEQFFIAHVVHSLMPWLVRWEQTIERDILGNADNLIAKFSVQALLRGNATDRANYYKAALGAGGSPAWMSQDEVRDLEELNPFGGPAGQLPVPTNIAPVIPTQPGNPADAGDADAI